MVRTCQVDEGISEKIQDWQESAEKGSVEIGLLVGTAGGKGVVLDIFKTPEDDGGKPVQLRYMEGKSVKRGNKSDAEEPEIVLETDLIVDHGAVVSQMLPGGVWIIGLYLFSPNTSLKLVQQALCACLKVLRRDCNKPGYAADEMLLLHVSSSNKKVSMKVSPDVSRDPVNLVNCEHSLAAVRPMPCLKCRYQLDIELPLGKSISTRKKMWKELINIEKKKIELSLCVQLDGLKPLDGSQPIRDTVSSSEPMEVCFVVPLDTWTSKSENGSVHGKGHLSGILEARAYSNEKEPMEKCIKMLKADLLNTLQSRLNWMEDDQAPEDPNDPGEVQLKHCVSVPLPRRVWLPWKSGTWMCDYADPMSEDIEFIVENAALQLSALQLNSEEVVDTETTGKFNYENLPPWEPRPPTTSDDQEKTHQPSLSQASHVAGAINPTNRTCSILSATLSLGAVGAVSAVALAWFSME